MARYHGKHHYIGAWHYVLLDILYIIPLIGLIFLLIHAFDHTNENRLHYARSYFVRLLLALIISATVVGLMYIIIGADESWNTFNNIINMFNQQK